MTPFCPENWAAVVSFLLSGGRWGLGAGTAVGGQLLLPLKLCRRGRGPVWLPFDLLAIFLPGVQEDSLRLFWDGGLGN